MKGNKLLFSVIVLAASFTQFAADIYAPSLPAIAQSLHTTIQLSQLSMTIYMFGVAFTLLIYGPLSDHWGRKKPMLIGLSIALFGSFICLFADNIHTLIVGRFIQGCGAGACAGLWRSIFRDVFTGEELAKYGSYFAILIMFIVPVAPALGGYLQHFYNWQASFIFMCCYAAFALALIFIGYHETHQNNPQQNSGHFIEKFCMLLRHRVFMGITLCTFLSYGAFFAWITTGPILLIHIVGISPATFGIIIFLGGGITYALAGWLNGRFVTRFGMTSMLRFGWSIMIFSGILMLTGKILFGTDLWAIVIPILFFYFGSTFIWPNAFAIAFTPFGHIAGCAGALYGFMQIVGGAIIGSLITYLPHASQMSLAGVILVMSILAWMTYEKVAKPDY